MGVPIIHSIHHVDCGRNRINIQGTCGCDTMSDAEVINKYLKEHDYCIDGLSDACKDKITKSKYHRRGVKNYTFHKSSGKYIVYKKSDGCISYFGLYETEDDAKLVADVLRDNDWIVAKDMCDLFGNISISRIKENYII